MNKYKRCRSLDVVGMRTGLSKTVIESKSATIRVRVRLSVDHLFLLAEGDSVLILPIGLD